CFSRNWRRPPNRQWTRPEKRLSVCGQREKYDRLAMLMHSQQESKRPPFSGERRPFCHQHEKCSSGPMLMQSQQESKRPKLFGGTCCCGQTTKRLCFRNPWITS